MTPTLPTNYDIVREHIDGKRYYRNPLTGEVLRAPVPYRCKCCQQDATYWDASSASWLCVAHWVPLQIVPAVKHPPVPERDEGGYEVLT